MGRVADLIRARFDKFAGDGRPFLDMVEWPDEQGAPLRVYWTPTTVDERARAFAGGRAAEHAYAELIAAKAQDAAGNRLFPDLTDVAVLRTRCDVVAIARLAMKMIEAPTVMEAVGNSRPIPTA